MDGWLKNRMMKKLSVLFLLLYSRSLVVGANNHLKTYVKQKTELGFFLGTMFFFLYLENPWKKPAKTHTRLLRVRVLRGYKFTYPDPYPWDPYP